MRKAIYLVFFLTTISIYSQDSDIQILQKIISKLNDIESVFYTSKFEGNESRVTYINSDDEIFFDFTQTAEYSTPRYFIKNKDAELIFNGKHHIQSLNKEKLIVTRGSRNPNNPLLLTLYPIIKLLPQLINNKSVEIERKDDFILNGQDNYVFEISLKNSVIDWEKLRINTFDKADANYNKYSLIINKSDYIPRKIIMPNGPSGTLSRTVENLNFNYKIDNKIWTGALLSKEYKRITFEDYLKQMQQKMILQSKENITETEKQKIGEWKIPNLENDKLVDFSKFKGNVVLLEFWFKFCGPCVKAVPELNALREKYKINKFLLYGVEFREDFPKENLQEYVSKIKINYPVLYKGKELANTYSVQAAPTFMIIDKKGNVVYLESGFDKEKIERVIKDNL
ncbi:TlpA family protein disulfide reductase [Croceitalea marina]|uniref:TlpA family protein disulfide reductase n=1 Tax=Croceitalea marina TaxID=1775166 RepID=A0ABW5MXQ9_9FLAO